MTDPQPTSSTNTESAQWVSTQEFACLNKPEQTGSTHRQEEISFCTSLLLNKNVYINIRISCRR